MPKKTATVLSAFLLLFAFNGLIPFLSSSVQTELRAQSGDYQLVKNMDTLMEIPDLQALAASETHMYALSGEDGLVVFRVHADSLQWLYSSEGMQRRGNRLHADVRFAYLTGSNNRLTIVEPTSVLGVYSSTNLPSRPISMARSGDYLFLGMDSTGLFRLPLSTPEAVDTAPEQIEQDRIRRNRIYAVRVFDSTLLALASNNELHQYRVEDGELIHEQSFSFGPAVSNLFIIDEQPVVTGSEGTVYEISSSGNLNSLFQVNGAIDDIQFWNDTYLVRTRDGQVWKAQRNGSVEQLRRDGRAGNMMALTRNQLWMTDYDQVTQLMRQQVLASSSGQSNGDANGFLQLSQISNVIVPYPRPVIIPIEFERSIDHNEVSFQIRSSISNAMIRDQGFFWQPGSRDIGTSRFTIIASTGDGQVDSTSFNVDIRAFNAPPRFNPVRPLSIPVGEEFSLPVRASDPDGSDPDLIRYLGVDLPDGARINERTGLITWTPTRRQAGEHEFQVIATDQFGSASSLSITINVMELTRGN
ncbi:MAG: Ig domain-containing protein [Balneolia bacterium]|nr:Ig domain-containing protein [Balneolia bacterium]